ncbi:T9SS type A sorting domain-containing protein [bacterium]|nr:T9SS type A sorting domain-containing protein [bacterium]
MKRYDIKKWITVKRQVVDSTKQFQQQTPPKHYSCLVPRLRWDDATHERLFKLSSNSHSYTLVFILFTLILSLAILSPSHAQWVDGGMLVSRYHAGGICQFFPIDDGGFWMVYEDPTGTSGKTRVQRFDVDGYAYFPDGGLRPLPDSLSSTQDLFGAVQRPDGGITVCVVANINEEYPWSIYAQAFDLEGYYLFGPTGAVVNEHHASQWTPWGGNFPAVVPDGNGGLWVYYEKVIHEDLMWIAGINADGTRKIQGEWYFEEYFSDRGANPVLGEDSEGGVYLIYPHQDEITRYNCYHIMADGTLDNEEPVSILDSIGTRFRQIVTHPNVEGAIYFTDLEYGRYQKINAGLGLPWGISGIESDQGGITPSRPKLCADGGMIAMYMSRQDHIAKCFRVKPDGSPYYEEYIAEIDSLDIVLAHEFEIIPSLDGTEFTTVYLGHQNRGENFIHYQFIRTFHFDSLAVNQWSAQSVEVLDQVVTRQSGNLNIIGPSVRTTDGGAVFAASFQFEDRGNKMYLYKINSDGTVAGRETSVGDDTQPAAVKGFRLRSAFPNPFNGTVTLRVDLAYPGNYEWTVYSLTGQEVASKSLTTHHAGLFEQTWTPGESHSSGVYLVRWTKEGQHLATKKLVYLP